VGKDILLADGVKSVRIARVVRATGGGRRFGLIVGAALFAGLGLLAVHRLHRTAVSPQQGATVASRPDSTRPRPRPVTIAVLPLQDPVGGAQEDYFADGMTESLISALETIDALRVISRTSAMEYKRTRKSSRDVAGELGADWIVSGSVQRDGDRVRLAARLIDPATEAEVWAESYERSMRDILNLQLEVASAVARKVNAALTPEVQARLSRQRSVAPDAYIAYVRGRYAWNLRTRASSETAIPLFKDAIALEPEYAEAYSGLADCYNLLASTGGVSRDAMRRAQAAAIRAVELDPELAEAHASLAWVRYRSAWDWPAAEKGFLRAIRLNPGYATTHQWYASFLSAMGRHSEAIVEVERAIEADPRVGVMYRTAAMVQMAARRFRAAEAAARKAMALDPTIPAVHLTLARVLEARGDVRSAIEVCERIPVADRTSDFTAYLGYFLGRAGQKDRARALLEQVREQARLGQGAVHHPGLVYLGLGDKDAALTAFEQAAAERSPFVLGLKTLPLFDPLRGEPRFQALLKVVGLPG
jgi:TolB-like protein/Tfp pilus assembly protein PilF